MVLLLVLLLLRYNELGLKSPRVRRRFQRQMINNIENKFLDAGIDCFINIDWGRIYLETDKLEDSIRLLQTVFGLTSVSPVLTTTSNLIDITEATIDFSKTLLYSDASFALRTRRTGEHDFTSMSLAEHVGSAILDRFKERELKVNLTKPEVEIFIEVRNNRAYIYSETYPGPGGLPLGTQGKIVSIFNQKYSYLASWLLMKRGCRIYPVYFGSNAWVKTITSEQAQEQVTWLNPWAKNLSLKVIGTNSSDNNKNTASINNYINNKELKYYLQKIHAKGICFGYQFNDIPDWCFENQTELPIFFPLIGLDDNYIKRLEEQIKNVE